MCISKKEGTWRRSARRVLAAGALTVVTFAGHQNLRGEDLGVESRADLVRETMTEVREALASAAAVSPVSAERGGQATGGTWIPLTGLERASRSIYW
jgi:hypothetical protein